MSEEIIDAAKEDLGDLENLYENLGFEYESVIKERDEEDELEQEESFEESREYFMLNNNQKEVMLEYIKVLCNYIDLLQLYELLLKDFHNHEIYQYKIHYILHQ